MSQKRGIIMKQARRMLCALLAVLLCVSMSGGFCVRASADYLDGDWESVKINNYNVHAFVLYSKLYSVTSFDLDIEVVMNAGARCENWNVWVRTSRGGSFENVGTIYVDGGSGEASKTIRLSTAKNIDAVALTPKASGNFSWTLYMGIDNPTYKSSGSSGPSSSSTYSGSALSGDWEAVKINSYSVHAYVLDTKLYSVKAFDLAINAEMKAGARCESWNIWVRSSRGGSFTNVGTIYVEGGSGEASKTVRLPNAMNVDAVAVTPKASGSFSWTMYMTLSNPSYSDAPNSSGDYLDGDWEEATVYANGRTYNTSAFALYSPVRCQNFDLYVNIEMKANAKCKQWYVFVRSNGTFYQVDELYLPSGTGTVEETIHMSKIRNIDAVAVVPTANGSYSWTISMAVSNPE